MVRLLVELDRGSAARSVPRTERPRRRRRRLPPRGRREAPQRIGGCGPAKDAQRERRCIDLEAPGVHVVGAQRKTAPLVTVDQHAVSATREEPGDREVGRVVALAVRPRRDERARVVAVGLARRPVLDVVLDVAAPVVHHVGARPKPKKRSSVGDVEAECRRPCCRLRRRPQRDRAVVRGRELERDVAGIRLERPRQAVPFEPQFACARRSVPARRVRVAGLETVGLAERRLSRSAELDQERVRVDRHGERPVRSSIASATAGATSATAHAAASPTYPRTTPRPRATRGPLPRCGRSPSGSQAVHGSGSRAT